MTPVARVYRTLDEAERDRWNAAIPGDNIYHTFEWLQTVEGSITPESARITVEAAAGGLVAGLSAHLVSSGAFEYYNPPALLVADEAVAELDEVLDDGERKQLRELIAGARDTLADAYPAAVCVAPFGYTSSLWHRETLGAEVIDRLIGAFEGLADDWGARSRAFLYLSEPAGSGPGHRPVGRCLRRRGYDHRLLDVACVLAIRWRSFEDYLASFPAKRRYKLRREARQFEGSGLTVSVEPGSVLWDEAVLDTLAAQVAAVQAKYGHGFDLERERDALDRIRRCSERYARVILVRDGDRLIGFHLFYETGDVLHSAMAVRGETVPDDHVYFNLYYELIRVAIAGKARMIDFGSGSYQTKLLRGCGLREQLGYFRFADGNDRVAALLAFQDRAQRRLVDSYRRRYGSA